MDVLSALMVLLPLVWPWLVVGLFLLALPELTRRDLFFGVTINPTFRDSEPARAIHRRYRTAIGAATLIAIALGVTEGLVTTGALSPDARLAALLARPGLQRLPLVLLIAVQLWAYVRANRAMRPYAAQHSSVVKVELSTKSEPTSAIFVALAVPIASLVVLAVWTSLRWHDVPSRLAVHWAFAGPDRWISTTPAAVVSLLSVYAGVCLLLAVVTWAVLNGSRRIATSGVPAERERRFRSRFVSLLIATEYLAVLPVWASLLSLPGTAMRLWILIFPATILVLLARLVLVGQGGTRYRARDVSPMSAPATPVGDRTEDRYWWWGLFYFNRGDPSILVERRFGVGYSFNFAHPFAWAVVALIVAIPLIGRLL